MYKAHEIFARMPGETANQLFSFVFEKEKPLYKATIESLSQQRKLRPIFVERKPRAERQAWMKESLGRKPSEGVAAHLLQIWLIGVHKAVLCDFLDALGIAHDENGTIENLPENPTPEKVREAVEILLGKHDRGVVTVYLHAFQALDDEGWPSLETVLAEDPRLRLEGETVAA